ncbi:hypothetical protein AMTR_s00109p00148620 [Amborella trichopoda]|uniref:PGG domain-containing protein n=1 Tax=Amborella trichopoda TaxID=13333 RepID=W1NVM4_AMBTC|nr:hypothetical protein AMTR_s00109p00148620 [Amborella trichopoda]
MAIQFIKVLVTVPKIESNALNSKVLTALEALEQDSSNSYDMETQQVISTAGDKTSHESSSSTIIIPENNGGSANQAISLMRTSQSAGQDRKQGKKKPKHLQKQDWISKSKTTIMLVAVLIATITFQAGFTPPTKDTTPGAPITTDHEKFPQSQKQQAYHLFIFCDTVGLVTSLLIILLLMSIVGVKKQLLMRVLMAIMWISMYFTANAFFIGMLVSNYEDNAAKIIVRFSCLFFNGGMLLIICTRLLRLSISWWRKGPLMKRVLVVLLWAFAYFPLSLILLSSMINLLSVYSLYRHYSLFNPATMVFNVVLVVLVVLVKRKRENVKKEDRRKRENVKKEDRVSRGIELDIESGKGKD